MEGSPMQQGSSKKRRKTISVCSTDSEISVGVPNVASSKKKAKKGKLNASVACPVELTVPETPIQAIPEKPPTPVPSEDGRTSTIDELDAGDSFLGTEEPPSCESWDKMEDEDFVNCICQINEENGLMIQCDVCLCWQHAVCMEITQDTLPKKYVCYVCVNPPGARDSARYVYNQDWHREGALARFNFLPLLEDANSGRRSPSIAATHHLVGDFHGIKKVLWTMRQKISALKCKKGEEFQLWTKNWDKEEKQDDTQVVKTEANVKPEYNGAQTIVKKEQEGVNLNTSEVPGSFVVKLENKDSLQTVNKVNSVTNATDNNVEKEINISTATEQALTNSSGNVDGATSSTSEGIADAQTITSVVSLPSKMTAIRKPDDLMTTLRQSASFMACNGFDGAESATGLEMPLPVELTPEERSKTCENNLLENIMSMQNNIDTRLDDIESQLQELEVLESNGSQRSPDILRDMPALKKAIHHLIKDLSKVKRMARFH